MSNNLHFAWNDELSDLNSTSSNNTQQSICPPLVALKHQQSYDVDEVMAILEGASHHGGCTSSASDDVNMASWRGGWKAGGGGIRLLGCPIGPMSTNGQKSLGKGSALVGGVGPQSLDLKTARP